MNKTLQDLIQELWDAGFNAGTAGSLESMNEDIAEYHEKIEALFEDLKGTK